MIDVIGRLSFDGRGWENGLKQAGKAANKLGDDLSGSVKNKIGSIFAVAAIEESIRRTIEWGSKINDLSARVGTTAEEFQGLAGAAKLAGASEEDVVSFLEKINVARAKILSGGEEGEKLLGEAGAFGLKKEDFKNKSNLQITSQIASVVKDGDIEKLINPLRELGGRSAGALVSSFKDGLAEAMASIPRVSDSDIASLDAAGDALDKVFNRSRAEYAPLIVGAINLFSSAVVGFQNGIDAVALSIYSAYVKLNNLIGLMSDDYAARQLDKATTNVQKRRETREKDLVDGFSPKAKSNVPTTFDEGHSKEEKLADKIKKIYEEIGKIKERTALAGLSTDEKRISLLNKKGRMEDFIGPESALDKATRLKSIAEIDNEISGLKDSKEEKPLKDIPSDSLLKVGNFLGASGSNTINAIAKDHLSEARKHTQILTGILDRINPLESGESLSSKV